LEEESQSNIKSTLIKRSQRLYEDEQIVFPAGKSSQDSIWNVTELPLSKYPQLLIHRWLSLYILNKLSPDTKLDKRTLADFIHLAGLIVPPSTERRFPLPVSLVNVDLSRESLELTNLISGNLSPANLRESELLATILVAANLSNANLQEANLRNANLEEANLEGAIGHYYRSGKDIISRPHLVEIEEASMDKISEQPLNQTKRIIRYTSDGKPVE
jgi:hypothetical protein